MSNPNRRRATNYLYYFVMVAIFGVGIWLILATGSKLNSPQNTLNPSSQAAAPAAPSTQTQISRFFRLEDRSPLSILLLQIIVIIVVAKLFAAIFRRIGQPPVMGEMVAGISLGPSVLGLLAPAISSFLFPATSFGTLGLLSQIGVVLFMFIVGMEVDLEHLREKASSAIMVSHASIIVPFLLGAALSLTLFPALATPNSAFTPFALFMGIAMSITAFPVLARIIRDRKLTQSPLATTALACAAVDDVSAWCILAIVIAIAKSTGLVGALVTIGLTAVFILVMLLLVKPQLDGLIRNRIADASYSRRLLASALAFALASAWVTETIGIHALFGGFLAGLVMPSDRKIQTFFEEKIEVFSSTFLLPLFFVFTGLRTKITLLNDWWSWVVCIAIIIVAIAGKLGGSMLMARWTRMSWRDSFGIGVLMNTRGLMELVALNIGYDLGILSDRIFAMMVIMALTTTFMTAPLLSLVGIGKEKGKRGKG
ncbi:MAG TPA: cation:proton antiporter [Pyrinomonadaceae bacterium]|nr:cation:proton antiporter [Pyrinomonadaceae bacterium]